MSAALHVENDMKGVSEADATNGGIGRYWSFATSASSFSSASMRFRRLTISARKS